MMNPVQVEEAVNSTQFTLVKKGYSVEEVSEFLKNLVKDYKSVFSAATSLKLHCDELTGSMEAQAEKYNQCAAENDQLRCKLGELEEQKAAVGDAMTEAKQILIRSRQLAADHEREATEKAVTIISEADRQAAEILDAATKQAAKIIEDAENKAKTEIGSIESRKVLEESRLQKARIASREFLEYMDAACQLQRNKIQELLTAPAFAKPVEAPAEEEETDDTRVFSTTAD